jgi:hypothetical protein
MKLALFLAALPLFAQSDVVRLCAPQTGCFTLRAPATMLPDAVLLPDNFNSLLAAALASGDLDGMDVGGYEWTVAELPPGAGMFIGPNVGSLLTGAMSKMCIITFHGRSGGSRQSSFSVLGILI